MKNKRKKHQNIYSIDCYAFTSELGKINAGLKVLVSVMTLILCIVLNDMLISLAVILSMGAFTIIIGKVPISAYLGFVSIPIAFICLSAIAIAIEVSFEGLGYFIRIGGVYLCVSNESLIKAVNISLKALGCISALYMLTLSTPMWEIISTLEKIHIPKLIISLMDMIYRYIFILYEQSVSMKNSAKARLGYIGFKRSIDTFGKTAGNLFVISLKKANSSYDAMLSRCYDGELRFLKEEKSIEKKQILFSVFYFISLLLLYIIILKIKEG